MPLFSSQSLSLLDLFLFPFLEIGAPTVNKTSGCSHEMVCLNLQMNKKDLWETILKSIPASQILVTSLKYKVPASHIRSIHFHTCGPGAPLASPASSSPRRLCRTASSSHQHVSTEMCPVLSDTFVAVLFPGLGNHADLERSLERTAWSKFGEDFESLSHCVLQS